MDIIKTKRRKYTAIALLLSTITLPATSIEYDGPFYFQDTDYLYATSLDFDISKNHNTEIWIETIKTKCPLLIRIHSPEFPELTTIIGKSLDNFVISSITRDDKADNIVGDHLVEPYKSHGKYFAFTYISLSHPELDKWGDRKLFDTDCEDTESVILPRYLQLVSKDYEADPERFQALTVLTELYSLSHITSFCAIADSRQVEETAFTLFRLLLVMKHKLGEGVSVSLDDLNKEIISSDICLNDDFERKTSVMAYSVMTVALTFIIARCALLLESTRLIIRRVLNAIKGRPTDLSDLQQLMYQYQNMIKDVRIPFRLPMDTKTTKSAAMTHVIMKHLLDQENGLPKARLENLNLPLRTEKVIVNLLLENQISERNKNLSTSILEASFAIWSKSRYSKIIGLVRDCVIVALLFWLTSNTIHEKYFSKTLRIAINIVLGNLGFIGAE